MKILALWVVFPQTQKNSLKFWTCCDFRPP